LTLLEGVQTRKLRLIPDDRGFLMEILRRDWSEYKRFGQLYLTACYPGVVKAWHYHQVQWDHFVCVSGMAKVVLFDNRRESGTKGKINEFFIGDLNPLLIKIPPQVFHGFTAVGKDTALLLNIPTELYDYENPDEYRIKYDDPTIPYSWEVQHS